MSKEYDIKPKQQYVLTGRSEPIRIMAVAENYVLWRNKGCHPAVHGAKDFKEFLYNHQAILLA